MLNTPLSHYKMPIANITVIFIGKIFFCSKKQIKIENSEFEKTCDEHVLRDEFSNESRL